MGMFSNSNMMIGGLVVRNFAITDDADDGNDADGVWTSGSGNTVTGLSFALGDSGFRFTGVNIPAGATIVSADFQVEVNTVNNNGADAIIQAQDVNNAAAWNSVGPATMAVTTANVTRTLGTVQRESFDIKTMLQEVVDNRSGIGNALSVGVLDDGSAFNDWSLMDEREAAGSNEATLTIVYRAA